MDKRGVIRDSLFLLILCHRNKGSFKTVDVPSILSVHHVMFRHT